MIEKERVRAVVYTMGYKDFKGTDEEWTSNIWDLFNAKNNYNQVLKLDVFQGGRDSTGFYPNYVELIVKENSSIDWDGYLESLNYVYRKRDVTLQKLYVDWNENIYDVIVEVG